MREEIHLTTRPVLSHSADAVRAGGLLFVAGVLPVDVDGALVGGEDVAAQARHVLAEVGAILEAAGCGFTDLAKMNVYVTDVADGPRLDEVQRETFLDARSAATLVEVTGLAVPGAKVEIDAVAVLP